MEGTIKTFDSIKKFGYISYGNGESIFVHIKAFVSFIKANEINALVGKTVTFTIGEFNGRPTAVKVEIKKEGFELPEADASVDELIPYDERQRAERKEIRGKRQIAECYVGKRENRAERRLRQKKIEKSFDDAFDESDYDDED